MNFLFTDEQLELRASVRGFLAGKSAEQAVRRLMATPAGYDPAVWRQMSDQLGLAGLAVPEEYEGAGFGYLELGIVFEEMGRALLCAPYLSSVALAADFGNRRRQRYVFGANLDAVLGVAAFVDATVAHQGC